MTERRRILVATDGSEYAKKGLEYAVSLVGDGGEILLLHVVPYEFDPTTSFWKTPQAEVLDKKYLKKLREEAERLLEDEIKELEVRIGSIPSEIKIIPVVEFGEPSKKILEVAEKSKCDLIVLGVRGGSSWKKKLLGSVSNNVLERAKIPVLVIR